jgi:hypothetical protein
MMKEEEEKTAPITLQGQLTTTTMMKTKKNRPPLTQSNPIDHERTGPFGQNVVMGRGRKNEENPSLHFHDGCIEGKGQLDWGMGKLRF